MSTEHKLTELLTKKDFEKVANSVADCKIVIKFGIQDKTITTLQVDQIFNGMVNDISKILALTNPKFNATKFKTLSNGKKEA